ncbi:hypothetical protein DB792_09690 [Staphylococcus warneri]|nr:hypothetical protein DWB95_09660 [Staphylococcus pasteuri]RQX27110.1 hypothetical protein DB792_09690 [Staphylococcus warneri]
MIYVIIGLFLISIFLFIFSFFLSQTEGLTYKRTCRTIALAFLLLGFFSFIGHLVILLSE